MYSCLLLFCLLLPYVVNKDEYYINIPCIICCHSTVQVSNSQMVLRPTYPYQLPVSKTFRYWRDFIPYGTAKKFQIVCIIPTFQISQGSVGPVLR